MWEFWTGVLTKEDDGGDVEEWREVAGVIRVPHCRGGAEANQSLRPPSFLGRRAAIRTDLRVWPWIAGTAIPPR